MAKQTTAGETSSPVAIDETQLDREWLDHPERFYEAATELAEARHRVAEAKANLDVIEAQTTKKVRASPEKYEILKVTEGAIADAVKLTAEHALAVGKLNKAKYRQDMCQALVDALDHKKKALESLVYLHGQNYFSSPKVKLSPEMERAAEKARTAKSGKAGG